MTALQSDSESASLVLLGRSYLRSRWVWGIYSTKVVTLSILGLWKNISIPNVKNMVWGLAYLRWVWQQTYLSRSLQQ